MIEKAATFRSIALARRSVKRFQRERIIPSEILQDIVRSTLRSPSSFNLQPTQIIMCQSAKIKNELADHSMLGPGNQYRTRDASVVAIFLSDVEALKRIDRIYELEKKSKMRHPNYLGSMPLAASFLLGQGTVARHLKNIVTDAMSNTGVQSTPKIEPMIAWSYKNTSLLIQTYMLASTSYDLQTCVMEGYDSRKMKQTLDIPDRYEIPMVVATGYEYIEDVDDDDGSNNNNDNDESLLLTPRLGIDEVVFGETFGKPWKEL